MKGKVVKTTEEEYHLQNLITNDYHAIDKKDALVVAPQCLGKLLLFTSKRACPTCSNSATSPSEPSSTTSESGTPSSRSTPASARQSSFPSIPTRNFPSLQRRMQRNSGLFPRHLGQASQWMECNLSRTCSRWLRLRSRI